MIRVGRLFLLSACAAVLGVGGFGCGPAERSESWIGTWIPTDQPGLKGEDSHVLELTDRTLSVFQTDGYRVYELPYSLDGKSLKLTWSELNWGGDRESPAHKVASDLIKSQITLEVDGRGLALHYAGPENAEPIEHAYRRAQDGEVEAIKERVLRERAARTAPGPGPEPTPEPDPAPVPGPSPQPNPGGRTPGAPPSQWTRPQDLGAMPVDGMTVDHLFPVGLMEKELYFRVPDDIQTVTCLLNWQNTGADDFDVYFYDDAGNLLTRGATTHTGFEQALFGVPLRYRRNGQWDRVYLKIKRHRGSAEKELELRLF